MLREEYNFEDVKDYLYNKIDLLIAGNFNDDERSLFIYERWKLKRKDFLLIKQGEGEQCCIEHYQQGDFVKAEQLDLSKGLPNLLRKLYVERKNVMVDLSSLEHVLIMFLTKVLVTQIIPKSLFAVYIRPTKYCIQNEDLGFPLSDQILGVKSVPGFVKRESQSQILCSFIGFEGVRLKSIMEAVHNIHKLIPIVAFPSGGSQWYNITMWNCMDIIQSESQNISIRKCFSESIFEAVNVLQTCIKPNDTVILAPLGTRPHSMACALFACHHQNAQIIYDYAIEKKNRTQGLEYITVYHLSSFLNV